MYAGTPLLRRVRGGFVDIKGIGSREFKYFDKNEEF
jgi:hypothetical protein